MVLSELRGDVEKASGSELGAMRTKRFAKLDGTGACTLADVNNVYRRAIRARLTDAGISIDGHVSEARVRRHDHLVAIHAHFNGGKLAPQFRLDK